MLHPEDIFWDKVLIIACAVFLLVLSMAILIYIVKWSCCCLCGRSKKKNSLTPMMYLNNMNLLKKDMDNNFFLSEILSSSGESMSSEGSIISMRSDSTVSIISETNSNIQLLPVVNSVASSFTAEKPLYSLSPTIRIGLRFVLIGDEMTDKGKLHIVIKDISSLPLKEYPRYTEAYVTLSVLKVRRSIRGRIEEPIYTNQTRSFRGTRNIALSEQFIVDAKKGDLKSWSICLTTYDHDMHTEPIESASTCISLAEKFKELCSKETEIELTSPLYPIVKDNGNVLIGLSYLPTSQRLSINIMKVANLKECPNDKNGNTSFSPFAHVLLLSGVMGKPLKKKKLLFDRMADPYELNGTMSFDVMSSDLETVTLLIVLYNEDIRDTQEIDNFSAQNKDLKAANKRDNARYIGRIALGSLVTGNKEKKHWKMMLSVPRRVVTVWHTLK